MKINFLIVLCYLFSGLVFGGSDEHLKIENDGSVRFDPLLGRTTWTGTVRFDYAQFKVNVIGRVNVFGGPTLQKKTAKAGELKFSNINVGQENISLVALGEIVVQVTDLKGKVTKLIGKRLVLIFKNQHILLDGQLLNIKYVFRH